MPVLLERTVKTNGVELHALDAGEGPLVVLAHGFPELGFSWRHQLPALATAGFRCIAPDQRGYGRSTRPEPVGAYNIIELGNDLLGILDDVGEQHAVFVGHDWGAMVVWHLALAHPSRVAGVVGMSIPFKPRTRKPPTEIWRSRFTGEFFYMLYFQQRGAADAELARDPARSLRCLFAHGSFDGPAPHDTTDDMRGLLDRLPQVDAPPPWMSDSDFHFYVSEFTRTGFTSSINWYRNFDRNWWLTEAHDGAVIQVPSLFIAGNLDSVLRLSPPSSDGLEDHRGTLLIDGAGHWVQQERPEETNAALLPFLRAVLHSS